MLDAASSLVPVFLLIALGAVMRRGRFPGDAFWPAVESVTYYVFFPALLARSLAGADLGGFDPVPMAAALLSAVFVLAALVLAARRWLTPDGPAFTSVFQGAVRFNTFVGLGSVAALHGQAGVTLFAVAIAVMIPTLNVLCVGVLARYAHRGAPPDWRRQIVLLAQNPLILGCLAGIALNVSGVGVPWGVGSVLDILGRAALPLGLLAVGAGLDLNNVHAARRLVLIASGLKLVALPLLMSASCALFGVEGLTRTVTILWATLPGASNAYILARQMGGDATLMASIITVTTVGALVTMPVLLTWLP